MPTVNLQISPTPAHVRTARLVAAAVARRSGVPEVLLDEVRLAVGEACSRAVELHRRYAPGELVDIELCDDDKFVVRVRDQVAIDRQGPPADLMDILGASAATPDSDVGSGEFGLAVIDGLVDDVEIRQSTDGKGTEVSMTWPIGGRIPSQGGPDPGGP